MAAFKKAGIQGVEDFVSYLADATEQLIQSVKNGLSIEDNINGSVKTLTLKHEVATAVSVPVPKKTVLHMFPTFVSDFNSPIESFSWQYTSDGNLEVMASFRGAPTRGLNVRVVMLYK